MQLRPYQQDAVACAIAWIKKSTEPCLLELTTGAGKSLIVAAIANWIDKNTKKKVLVLQPSKELTEQNFSKYLATGQKASIFSASAGAKCTRYNVVYATPLTVLNSINRFGDSYGAIIIDEAHLITPTIKEIISKIKERNNLLRVIGMTATPYRMNSGYIYQYDNTSDKIKTLGENESVAPYYHSLLYRITTRELISMGFLTDAHTDKTSKFYDAEGLTLNNRGQFNASDIERVFEGKGRLTADIVADVVNHAHGRKGVMLFASTVQHAKEILESLPPGISRMIGGDVNMTKSEREKLITDFKQQRFKYIVSVGTLTTGFDAPHVDLIAILRATESASLLQQIIGRGLRLCEGKRDCLVLDYAKNIERHSLEIDLFEPKIEAKKQKESAFINVDCPQCKIVNVFAARPNPDKYHIDNYGYFLDLANNRIVTDDGEMPAHFGRRCTGYQPSVLERGKLERCEYRWTAKECEECGHDNDIAARYCEKCGYEMVNPNDKLTIESSVAKRDPYALTTEEVLFFDVKGGISKQGNEMLICTYTTNLMTFRAYYIADSTVRMVAKKWIELNHAVFGYVAPCLTVAEFIAKRTNQQPLTVTYCKNKATGYIDIHGHNNPIINNHN